MNRNAFLVGPAAAVVLAGCTLAPSYTRPAATVPAAWPSGAAYRATATAAHAPGVSGLRWQEFIADDRLRQVVAIALTNNLDLRLAALNVQRAWAMYGIQRGELLPKVDGVASGSRQRTPADLSNTGARQTTERYDVHLGLASWEIDFFGRIRSLKDRALEEYLATEQARRGAQVALVFSVANAYLALAADREGLALARDTLATQQDGYNLIKRRHELGLAPDLDLYRAQTQVEAARGEIARFERLVAQDENALNLLLASPAPAGLLPADLRGVTPPRSISAGMSSEVLLSRPDVLQAENLLRAVYADIGAARAALFPRISLTAALGVASSDLARLFDSGSGAWSYAPRISLPIFDTRAWSALRVTKVQREIALAEYEKAIQSAFRDVADALAQRGTVDDQLAAQQALADATAETYRLSEARYRRGIDSYLPVLDAQRSLFSAQQGLIGLRLARQVNLLALYKALGGGGGEAPAPNAGDRRAARRERAR